MIGRFEIPDAANRAAARERYAGVALFPAAGPLVRHKLNRDRDQNVVVGKPPGEVDGPLEIAIDIT